MGNSEELEWAFTFTEQRLVDKTGCISFSGILWEVGEDLIGMKVEVAYRCDNPEELEIFHEGLEPRKIKPLKVTEHTNPHRSVPQEEIPPSTSRELDAATGSMRNIKTSLKRLSLIALW